MASYRGRPVQLNVYDLIEKNDLLFDIGMGILHTGVVVDGREYSYGEGGGVVSSLPRNVLGVKYRETIEMGNTFLSPEQVKDVVHNLKVIYHGDNYNLISKNCNDFSNEFCKIIVGKEIPSYINRCASVANWITKKTGQLKGFVERLDLRAPTVREEKDESPTPQKSSVKQVPTSGVCIKQTTLF